MKRPTIRQLECCLALAENLHFGIAAEQCGIAQPPLTLQIQKLEALLGCKLFERRKTVRMTAAGEEFSEHVGRILQQVDRAVWATQRAARGETGQLVIGVPPTVLLSNLPAVISKFRARNPLIGFRMKEAATSVIEESVRSGELHIGFLRETQPKAPLKSRLYFEEPVVALLPAKHRLASRKHLHLNDLRDEPFVFFPRSVGPALHDKFTAACAAAGFQPNIVQEATQWQSVVAFVEACTGVALAPQCIAANQRPGIIAFPIPKLTTSVYTCWFGEPTPAAKKFLAALLRNPTP